MNQDSASVNTSLPHKGGSSLLHRSCHDCNRRKVRCNKSWPCNNCERLGVECSYPPPGRKSRKITDRPSNKANLASRLSHLEEKVKKLGAKDFPEEPSSGLPPEQKNNESAQEDRAVRSWLAKHGARDNVIDQSRDMEENQSEMSNEMSNESTSSRTAPGTLENQFGRLVVDRNSGTSRYVNHQVLMELANQVFLIVVKISTLSMYDRLLRPLFKIREVRDVFDSPESPTLSEEDSSAPAPAAVHFQKSDPFKFGFHSVTVSLRDYHPPPIICYHLFNAFQENVAPIILIVHKPMLKDLLQTSINDPDDFDRGSEALVLSIYLAAIYSMSPEVCLAELGVDRTTLTKRYRFAVEQALARAGFLNTRKLVVLQAAVLFLNCACEPEDAHFVWTMTAVVTRLAQSLGLHRDSSHFGLGPFETEMRRRLWWYIYLLDVRSSDAQATSPQIREGDYDTLLPLNINDNDLSPNMMGTPPQRNGFTEMTLTLVRCEILILHRKLIQLNSVGVSGDEHQVLFQNRLQTIEEARFAFDERYLQFCDLQIPIHWVTATIARIALARSWLVSHFSLIRVEGFQRDSLPEKCDTLILTAIEVLEFVYLLESHEKTTKWSWLFQGYVQWQAFAFVLSELCVRPTSSLSDRAWAAVDRVYERWDRSIGNRLGLLMRPLVRLRNRAAAIRIQQSRHEPRGHIPVANNSNLSGVDDTALGISTYIEDFQGDLESLDIFKDVVNTMGL